MWQLHRTTICSSALIRRSISGLLLLRQVSPLRKGMNSRNDLVRRSSKAPASPPAPSDTSVIPYDSMITVGSIQIYYKISAWGTGIRLRQLVPKCASNPTFKEHCYSLSIDVHFNKRNYHIDLMSKLVNREDTATSSSSENASKFPHESSSVPDCQSEMDIYSSLPTEFGKERRHGRAERPHYVPRNMKYAATTKNSDCSKGWNYNEPFDICLSGSRSPGLKASLHARKMENQTEAEDMVEFKNPEHVAEFTNRVVLLEPGMVLLKHFLTLNEQVEIVKTCRELGLGPGGFYQPGFKDGAKLRLQMMCLGLNWDPETRKYDYKRAIDDTKPPGIPQEFSLLVERAIQEAHAHIKEELRVYSVEEILPSMSPDICIANFYTRNGRLGLHQDRDESRKSLQEGLPVVSFSVGDSADFLYGVRRDIAKAESVTLGSGDVLIFGGRSRHIFHGVTSIIPDSAPIALLAETGIRPGRLNLTFRKF